MFFQELLKLILPALIAQTLVQIRANAQTQKYFDEMNIISDNDIVVDNCSMTPG